MKKRFCLLWISIMLLVSSCARGAGTPLPGPTATAAPIASETYTIRPTAVPSLTPAPTINTTFEPTNTPTVSLTPTLLPTWTPLPTLPPKEAKAMILRLLRNNGGCKLPCWWGITPGKTSWQEAQNFLGRFAFINVSDKGNGYQIATVTLPSPVDVSYITQLDQIYVVHNWIVETFKTYNYKLATWYYLPNLLSTYGQPSAVGIRTFQNMVNNSQPLGVSLFYLDQGILVEYFGMRGGNVGKNIRFCPQDGTYNFMYTWSPDNSMTFTETVKMFLDTENMVFPLHLKEATGMDVQTFYETFKDSKTTTCLETPAELWPIQ